MPHPTAHPLHSRAARSAAGAARRAERPHPLQAMDGLERHGTDVDRALITDVPAPILQEPLHGLFGELTMLQDYRNLHHEIIKLAPQPPLLGSSGKHDGIVVKCHAVHDKPGPGVPRVILPQATTRSLVVRLEEAHTHHGIGFLLICIEVLV